MNKSKNKIAVGVFLGITLLATIIVWGMFLFGGFLQRELIDSPKFIQTADNQFYYIKDASWAKTFFLGGIIKPSQIHIYENNKEIPAIKEVLWPDQNLINGVNQVIITFTTPDHSDPRANGREYTLAWDWKPGIFPLTISLILMLSIINFGAVFLWRRSPLTDVSDRLVSPSFQRSFVTGVAILLMNLVLLVIVFIIISILVKNHIDQSAIDSQIWPIYHFRPEQVERTQYMAGLMIFPIFSLMAWYGLGNLKWVSERTITALFPVLSIELVIGLGAILFNALQQNDFYYIKGIPLYDTPWTWISVFLLLLGVAYMEYRYPSKLLNRLLSAAIFISLLVVLTFVGFLVFMNEYDPFMVSITPHFSAYMYSIDQVFKGKTLLVDLTNQYGFYPYFLEPVFKLIGMGTFQLVSVMTILLVVFFGMILFLVSRLVKSRLIYLCAIWIIPGTWLWGIYHGNFENYYQFWPHRVLFPGLILLLIWLYQKTSHKTRRAVYIVTFILCGIALLWNFDTGFIVILCWAMFLAWETLGQWHSLGLKKTIFSLCLTTINTLIVLALSFCFIYYYTLYRSGQFPDINNYFYYQSIFYGSGFFMLPMPAPFHMWNLVLLIYAIGIYLSISRLVKKLMVKNQPYDLPTAVRDNMIFVVSIMACGLFSFYQGRSDDSNLVVTFWSFWFLLILFSDQVFQNFFAHLNKPASLPDVASILGNSLLVLSISFVLFSYVGGIISLSPSLVDRVGVNISNITKLNQGISTDHAKDIPLINRYFKPGDDVLILASADQAYLYIKSGTKNPIQIPSFSELFTKIDYQKVVNYLSQKDGGKIIMSKSFGDDFPDLYHLVKQNFVEVDTGNFIGVYAKK